MLGFSLTEIILLGIIALVVIGPKQLPEVARNLGRLLNELRRTSNSFTREFRENMNQARIDPIRLDDKDEKPQPPKASTHPSEHAHDPVPPVAPQFPLAQTHDHVEPATIVKKENDPS